MLLPLPSRNLLSQLRPRRGKLVIYDSMILHIPCQSWSSRFYFLISRKWSIRPPLRTNTQCFSNRTIRYPATYFGACSLIICHNLSHNKGLRFLWPTSKKCSFSRRSEVDPRLLRDLATRKQGVIAVIVGMPA